MTNTQSEFGVQYDSLADLVSFGVAPALVMYHWSLSNLIYHGPVWGKVGWAVAFLYVACAALRLARFNTQVGVVDKRYFIGLASPAAAGALMAFVWAATKFGYGGADLEYAALAMTVMAALLMVSRIRYHSGKALPFGDRVPFVVMLGALGLFVAWRSRQTACCWRCSGCMRCPARWAGRSGACVGAADECYRRPCRALRAASSAGASGGSLAAAGGVDRSGGNPSPSRAHHRRVDGCRSLGGVSDR